MARIEIKSEITGTVWQVKSQPGDKVESGDTLLIVESMKMEIPVITEDAGTVVEVLVQKKDPVAEGLVDEPQEVVAQVVPRPRGPEEHAEGNQQQAPDGPKAEDLRAADRRGCHGRSIPPEAAVHLPARHGR